MTETLAYLSSYKSSSGEELGTIVAADRADCNNTASQNDSIFLFFY
ncbi:MAG: hypothetical protein QXV84_01780 [Conexivisphaerales archaeon]